ncbi:hypothetical protein CC86DRAFT_461884 [Ophiobolus disseminans]|uniref:DUF7918 domain-containing protein n=1 Tax=Ophiobolus disseminans TaxID=1469910 RepID=A0A6A7AK82_9PLEO|nr:hypothetical protein CC86DRAFT_461884 [Ophiobolus disseminans]
MEQAFRFSELVRDETTGTIDTSLVRQLAASGQIMVPFHMIHNERRKVVQNRFPVLRDYDTVPEKAMKGSAVSHTAGLDPLKPVPRSPWWDCEYVYATLKSLTIIPRTPSPEPLENRPTNSLSPNELAQLVNRYRIGERLG